MDGFGQYYDDTPNTLYIGMFVKNTKNGPGKTIIRGGTSYGIWDGTEVNFLNFAPDGPEKMQEADIEFNRFQAIVNQMGLSEILNKE